MFEPKFQPLYDRYNRVLKPLIAEYESRNEDFVTPLLTDLPEMFDHIAIYRPTNDEKNITAASQHLDKAINEVRTCVVGSMMVNVKKFKSDLTLPVLKALGSGHFYGQFSSLEQQVRKYKDSDMEKTYSLLKSMETMMNNNHDGVLVASQIKDSHPTVVTKWIVSIIIALLLNVIFYNLF